MTEDPSFWDWLWFTALDGIGGGLLGGAIAAWALRRTIQHERRQANDSEVRNAVAALRGRAMRFSRETTRSGEEGFQQIVDSYWELNEACLEVQAVAAGRYPVLATDVESFLGGVSLNDVRDTSETSVWVTSLIALLHGWSRDPVQYEKNHPVDWAARVGARQGQDDDSAVGEPS